MLNFYRLFLKGGGGSLDPRKGSFVFFPYRQNRKQLDTFLTVFFMLLKGGVNVLNFFRLQVKTLF